VRTNPPDEEAKHSPWFVVVELAKVGVDGACSRLDGKILGHQRRYCLIRDVTR